MVNARKHKILKVINTITAPERTAVQLENKKKFYNKSKYRVNSFCNLQKLEELPELELIAHNKK